MKCVMKDPQRPFLCPVLSLGICILHLWSPPDDGKERDHEGETSPLLQNVHFFAVDGKDMGVLWEVQPAFVIVYNPDISFVRQLEVLLRWLTLFRSSSFHYCRKIGSLGTVESDKPGIGSIQRPGLKSCALFSCQVIMATGVQSGEAWTACTCLQPVVLEKSGVGQVHG